MIVFRRRLSKVQSAVKDEDVILSHKASALVCVACERRILKYEEINRRNKQ